MMKRNEHTRRSWSLRAALLGFLILSAGAVAWALETAGSLDTSFGDDGVVVTTMNPYGTLTGLVTQSDDKIVVVGQDRWNHPTEYIQWAIHRYNTDGSLDSTFGSGGRVNLFGGQWDQRAIGATMGANDKILVAGSAHILSGRGKKQTLAPTGVLVCLNPDGTLDSTFGTGGKAYALEFAVAVARQSDGRIVVAGYVTVSSAGGGGKKKGGGPKQTSRAFALARFDADGDLDTTFGEDGILVHDITTANSSVMGSGDDTPWRMAIDSGDRNAWVNRDCFRACGLCTMTRLRVVTLTPGCRTLTRTPSGRSRGSFSGSKLTR